MEHVARKSRFLLSVMSLVMSAIIICEAVGGSGERWAISDRDMRSERRGFERGSPPGTTWAWPREVDKRKFAVDKRSHRN